ncbi:hypothetical protein TCA2_4620 [Paenibacillus sp. TCA20]|uniref:Uncharacterized protein n=1 Tax=Paenibacillus urinalis TaxID=521520 RepID=A0ABY7XGR3_9BACL|nr:MULTISPECIES: hypothetical protein [Paenibacillus]WDI05046.1 hypothetical protein PUW25_26110 [Paenibacillus urinalis]GAK42128.1 hypothetical protein TCA2_4620 [Paenibacillus sp. TCA20]
MELMSTYLKRDLDVYKWLFSMKLNVPESEKHWHEENMALIYNPMTDEIIKGYATSVKIEKLNDHIYSNTTGSFDMHLRPSSAFTTSRVIASIPFTFSNLKDMRKFIEWQDRTSIEILTKQHFIRGIIVGTLVFDGSIYTDLEAVHIETKV